MARQLVMKGLVRGSENFRYFFAVRVSPEEKSVSESYAVSGTAERLSGLELTLPLRDLINKIKTLEFSGKLDPARTQDIDRYFKKLARNPDQRDQMLGLMASADLEALRYNLSLDLEVALGEREPLIELVVEEYREQEAVAEAEAKQIEDRLPMAFIVAPFSGTPISHLRLGQQVLLRFEQLREERTRTYLTRHGFDLHAKRHETNATLRSLETIKSTHEILALLDLPDGTKAYARESESTIRVKTHADKRRQSDARPRTGFLDSPLLIMLTVIGLVAGAGLLYLFLFAF
ncbi:MAG: hypothetical protein H7A21_10905 [Spirochaetales bacterium]|nr:hypothetical protein [Leptospiraceae bacterium]MCP5481933.1 hypothetical protein [Spirochaetales bacterium]